MSEALPMRYEGDGKIPRPVLTQEIAQSALHYEQHSGQFIWKERQDRSRQWNGRYAGTVAGYKVGLQNNAYIALSLFNYPILAHRLAFLWMTGSIPSLIDHIDGNGLNNSWSNLRPATRIQNGANSSLSKSNTSGFKGVSFNKRIGKWRASISCGRKQISLGHFETAEDAHAAYLEKAKELFGEFARAA